MLVKQALGVRVGGDKVALQPGDDCDVKKYKISKDEADKLVAAGVLDADSKPAGRKPVVDEI